MQDETLRNMKSPAFMYPSNSANNIIFNTPGDNDDLFPMMLQNGYQDNQHAYQEFIQMPSALMNA